MDLLSLQYLLPLTFVPDFPVFKHLKPNTLIGHEDLQNEPIPFLIFAEKLLGHDGRARQAHPPAYLLEMGTSQASTQFREGGHCNREKVQGSHLAPSKRHAMDFRLIRSLQSPMTFNLMRICGI